MKKKLWQEISEALVKKITSGQWPVGSTIPGEMELAEQLEVSRDTIRKAMDALVRADFIERRPHVGTRVKSKVQNGKFMHELSDIRAIDAYGNQYPREVEEIEELFPDKTLSAQLSLTLNEPWLRLRNIRKASKHLNEAVVVTYVYVRHNARYIAEEARQNPRALMVSLLEQNLDTECVEVRQTFSATKMDAFVAKHFNCEVGAACLKIVRCYLDRNGNTITASESFHPADRFAFTVSTKKKRNLSFLP